MTLRFLRFLKSRAPSAAQPAAAPAPASAERHVGRCLTPAEFDAAAFPRKLNLGSGNDPRAGYVNIDLHAWYKPDLVADITRLDFLPAGHYDEILAQDVLEHLPRTQTLPALAHWNRLLRPGGTIMLRVPNVLGLADLLREPQRQNVPAQEELVQFLFGSQAHTGDVHFTTFTPFLLGAYLERSGLRPVRLAVVDQWNIDAIAEKIGAAAATERDFSHLLSVEGDEAFVSACYREILQREPDAEGRRFFLGGLREGGMPRATMITAIVSSPEYRNLRASAGG